MTKKEAISFLQDRVDLIDKHYPGIEDYREALDMAIKALEQEGYYKDLAQSYEKTIVKLTEAIAERQPNEDCVSRKAVLNTLDDMDKVLDEDRTVENYKAFLKECYKVLTPVTPARKKEKWIEISDNATKGDMIKEIFPNYRVEDRGGSIYLHYPDGGWIVFDRDWWNTPYKKEVEE